MFTFFQRTKDENGKYKKPYYSFRNVKSDKVLDVAQDGQSEGSLIIWDGYAGQNQQFALKQNGQHFYFKCRKNKQYLTVESEENGAKFFLAPKTFEANQRFKIEETQPESKDYAIYTYSGKVLDVAEQGTNNGTKVVQWEYNGGKNQLFNLCDPHNITSESSQND